MIQAVILAGGKATRMRPYTDDRPKAMVEIAGTPIVEHQLRWLAKNGVEHVVVSCGYKAQLLREHLGSGESSGLEITYAEEPEPLGRGGGLRFAAASLRPPADRWLGMNGDVLFDFPLDELIGVHEKTQATATVAMAAYQSTWGIADLEGDLIRGFVQSPVLPYWINGGLYCFEPEAIEMLPEKGDHEDDTFPKLAMEGKLAGYRIQGYWRGIDTVKDVLLATAEIQKATISGAP